MGAQSVSPPLEPSSPIDSGIRKRVCKACDRCRLKKSKCDGNSPCSRCKADNAICFFGERKKSQDKIYPKGYVEMLEAQQAQLVAGLQEMYKLANNGQGWIGTPLTESSSGQPLTHDILERLGVLKQEGQTTPAPFEENLEELQRKLIAGGAGFMQREMSFDASSDVDRQSFDSGYQRPLPFINPFQTSQFPPTPPQHPSHAATVRTSSPLKEQFPPNTGMQQYPSWTPEYDSMDFMTTYDPAIEPSLTAAQLQLQILQAQGSINPCLTMKEWDPQYFSPNGMTI